MFASAFINSLGHVVPPGNLILNVWFHDDGLLPIFTSSCSLILAESSMLRREVLNISEDWIQHVLQPAKDLFVSKIYFQEGICKICFIISLHPIVFTCKSLSAQFHYIPIIRTSASKVVRCHQNS